jgi:RNA recognition motif-containing protein
MADSVPNEIHVSNIPFRLTARDLGNSFNKFGKVVNVRIMTEIDRWGRESSRGFGFIEFETATSATAAINATPPVELNGRVLLVRAARPRTRPKRDTIFVLGIPEGTTEDDLRAVFGKYNPTAIRIVRTAAEGGRGYAFIQFASEADQTTARDENRSFRLKGGEARTYFAKRSFGARRPGRFAPRGRRAQKDPDRQLPPRSQGTSRPRGGARGPRGGAAGSTAPPA